MNMMRTCIAILSCLYRTYNPGTFTGNPSTCVYVGMVSLTVHVFLDMTNLSFYWLLKRWAPGFTYLFEYIYTGRTNYTRYSDLVVRYRV